MYCIATAIPAHALDCNSNGIDDATDIAVGTSFDCDANDMPDECEVSASFSGEKIISTVADSVWSVFAADIDGDGLPDVISGSTNDHKIGWFKNLDGRGTFGPRQVITTQTKSPQTIYVADVDGDGDNDILAASRYDETICWVENLDGQGTFGPKIVINGNALGARSVFPADFDGDGDLDVLTASADDDTIAWYENTNGFGTFALRQVIIDTSNFAYFVHAADLNGDNSPDALFVGSSPGHISWSANTNGLGGFGPEISAGIYGSRIAAAADIDGDGDNDIVGESLGGIVWISNTDGLGTFGPPRLVSDDVDLVFGVVPADLDGDGDVDVISASYSDDKVAWYENIDGLGTFGPQQILSVTLNGAQSVFASDLDGDGDLDVLASSVIDDKIAWFRNFAINDCNENGTPDDCEFAVDASLDCNGNSVLDGCELAEHDCNTNGVPDDCDLVEEVSADCNNNGVLDSCELTANDCNVNAIPDDCDLAGLMSTDCNSNGLPDECDVLMGDCNMNNIPDECDVAGGTSGDCNGNDVPDECESACDDCNTNGIPDVFDIAGATSSDCNRNSIPDECEPEGNDCNENSIRDDCELQPDFSERNIIGYPSYAGTMVAVDLDGDGDNDILTESTFDATVAWYRNVDGAGGFGPAKVISTAQLSGLSIFAADVDSDGDADVFVTSSNEHDKVYWYENMNGKGDFGPRNVIDVFTASGSFPIFVADLDSDGDADVLTAQTWYGDVVWYKNIDGLGNFAQEQAVSISTISTDSLFAADVDGDGDNDALAADGFYGRVNWYENMGGLGDFDRRKIISSDAHDVNQVLATDLDGDGDLDVLTAGETGYKIAWYENTDGHATFGPQQVINHPDDGAHVVFATDFDADGDIDILSASSATDTIAWYENIDGHATFAPPHVITSGTNIWSVVGAADLDGDGDLDVLANYDVDETFAWHERISRDCNHNLIPDDCDISAGTSEDINNNLTPDMCEPDCNGTGFPDDYDVLNLLSEDCNFNMQPDECEDDCNGSGAPDDCDVANQTSNDCNFNNFPDECELFANDCNTDNIPDDCQLTLLEDSLSTPAELYACPGQDAQITVSSSLTGLTYNWQKIGVPMVEGVDAIGTDTATLTILNADSFDIGTYFCEVSFGCISTTSERISLSLFEPFNIEQQPAAISNTCMGNTVAIGVTATGNELTYEWLKDGIPISETPGKYENVATSTLYILDANQSDLAEYSCIVRDQCGGEETTTSAFIQFGDATFVTQPVGQCTTDGDTVSYTAVADGGIYPIFSQWHKNGSPLTDGGNISGSFTDTLVIQNVGASDQGIYAQRALTLGANCATFSESVELAFDSCVCNSPGDMDSDGDLDLADLQIFAECFGTNVGELAGCACANVDNTDASIDLDDWAAYANILTGP